MFFRISFPLLFDTPLELFESQDVFLHVTWSDPDMGHLGLRRPRSNTDDSQENIQQHLL